MTGFDIDRRKVLKASGVALTAAVAGCLGDDDDGNGDVPDAVADHLSDANNYDGTLTDLTGQDEVEVTVGPGGDFSYDPAAILIDAGTTVNWTWDSSGHSVTSVEGDEFDSDIQNEGFEFSHTFDNPGNHLYVCEPHTAQGHLGAVVVE